MIRAPQARARDAAAGNWFLFDGEWLLIEAVIPHRSPLGGETVTIRPAGGEIEVTFDPSEPVTLKVPS